jgi:hypothetical protein
VALLPNRLATYAGIATGIIGAVVPVAIDMDTTTVAGWITGVGAIIGAIGLWMVGWQKHEGRTASAALDDPTFPLAPDEPQAAAVVVMP